MARKQYSKELKLELVKKHLPTKEHKGLKVEISFSFYVTKSSQNNQHSPLDSANNACYSTYRTKEERKRNLPEKVLTEFSETVN